MITTEQDLDYQSTLGWLAQWLGHPVEVRLASRKEVADLVEITEVVLVSLEEVPTRDRPLAGAEVVLTFSDSSDEIVARLALRSESFVGGAKYDHELSLELGGIGIEIERMG